MARVVLTTSKNDSSAGSSDGTPAGYDDRLVRDLLLDRAAVAVHRRGPGDAPLVGGDTAVTDLDRPRRDRVAGRRPDRRQVGLRRAAVRGQGTEQRVRGALIAA